MPASALPLYARDLLEASADERWFGLPAGEGGSRVTVENRLCADRLQLWAQIVDGRLHARVEVDGSSLARGAAVLVLRELALQQMTEIGPLLVRIRRAIESGEGSELPATLAALTGFADYPNRRASVLLIVDALERVVGGESRRGALEDSFEPSSIS